MSAFEVVTIVVCVVALVLAGTSYFRVNRVLQELGRQGPWFSHADDVDAAGRPSEDGRDAPIPKRPLRGRQDWSWRALGTGATLGAGDHLDPRGDVLVPRRPRERVAPLQRGELIGRHAGPHRLPVLIGVVDSLSVG